MHHISKSALIVLSSTLVFSSCSSTTVISTEPSGARLYINGMKAGETPYTYTDTKIIGSATNLIFKKEGYEDKEVVMRRNEEVSVGAIIGGIFVLVPFLWAMEYIPDHNYELEKVPE